MKRQDKKQKNSQKKSSIYKRQVSLQSKFQPSSPLKLKKKSKQQHIYNNLTSNIQPKEQLHLEKKHNSSFVISQKQYHQSQISKDWDLYRPVPCLNDDFSQHFRNNSIDQWNESSIKFFQLQPYIQAAIKTYQDTCQTIIQQSQQKIRLLPLRMQKMNLMKQLNKFVSKLTNTGYQKYLLFLQYKLAQILYNWQQLRSVLYQSSIIEIRTHQHCLNRHFIKQIIKIIFTNIHCLHLFIKVNEQCLEYIHQVQDDIIYPMIQKQKKQKKPKNLKKDQDNQLKKFENQMRKQYAMQHKSKPRRNTLYNIHTKSFGKKQKQKTEDQIPRKKSYDLINQSEIVQGQLLHDIINVQKQNEIRNIAQQLEDACRSLYGQMVYMDQNKTHRLDNIMIVNISQGAKETSKKDFFLSGLFIGLTLLTVITMLGLFFTDLIDIHEDDKSVSSFIYIFPAFRGIGLFILYLWGNAWNVYGFWSYHINYRFILQYGTHFSTYFQIVKRAGFFTLVFIAAFLFYVIGEQYNIQSKNQEIPIVYSPFFVWVLFFGYIFFPNRQVFNPRGRKYFYRLLKDVIFSPIGQMCFLIAYATDQAVSFVVPIKDLAYTICYYTSDLSSQSVKQCLNTTHFQGVVVTYIVAIIPLLFRMIQCYNIAVQTSGKFKGHIQFWNFFKYTASLTTATISFVSTFVDQMFWLFVVSSLISTSYSYYWDLKYDWGLLEKDSKYKLLRNHLSYKNPYIYYAAIGVNLIMRSSWTLTISASVTDLIPKSTFLPFLTGLLQILRRCMWNFFRIQKEHIHNCSHFRIAKDVDTIFKQIQKNQRQLSKNDQDKKKDDPMLSNLLDTDSFFYIHSEQALSSVIPVIASISESEIKSKEQQFKRFLQEEKKILKQAERNIKLKKCLQLK